MSIERTEYASTMDEIAKRTALIKAREYLIKERDSLDLSITEIEKLIQGLTKW